MDRRKKGAGGGSAKSSRSRKIERQLKSCKNKNRWRPGKDRESGRGGGGGGGTEGVVIVMTTDEMGGRGSVNNRASGHREHRKDLKENEEVEEGDADHHENNLINTLAI